VGPRKIETGFLDTDLSTKPIKYPQSKIQMSAAIASTKKTRSTNASIKIQTIKDLAEKYGFDADEAQLFLKIDDSPVKKRSSPEDVLAKKIANALIKKEIQDAKDAKKAKKAAKAAKPKRKLTGYLMYLNDQRAVVRQALIAELEEGEKLKPQNVVCELAKMWKALSDEERDSWNATAKKSASSDEEEEEEEESETEESE